MNERVDVYEKVTNLIISLLEQGVVPWHKPWRTTGGMLPTNLISKKAYRGLNIFVLLASGFSSPYWLTFKQCNDLGGRVRKGSKGMPVVYWNWIEKDDKETGKPKKIPFIRCSTVFNVEQCEGIEEHLPKPVGEVKDVPVLEACEKLVADMPKRPEIKHAGDRASYSPLTDIVAMPERNSFDSSEAYYETLFHELVHSTGHESRVGRKFGDRFGDEVYSKEELVAEMGAAFLCGTVGIVERTASSSAAYLQHWIGVLKGDKQLVVCAASAAQKASDFILGVSHAETPVSNG